MSLDMSKFLNAAPVPGGCDECDADQVVEQAGSNVFLLTVRHDDDCPRLRRIHSEGR